MAEPTRKILLATDGSPEASRAAGLAGELARDLGAELHLLYVRPIPESYINQWYMAEPEFLNELSRIAGEEAREKAEEEARKVGKTGAEVSGVHAEVGRPDNEIVRLAEELGVEMVVVGSRGLGALRRALMGSVSMSVVRHAHGSVLVVRGESREGGHLPGRVLLALDGSKEAEAAAGTAEEISRATGSDLHLVHVLHDAPPAPYPHPLAKEGWERHLEEIRTNARAFMEEKASRIEEAGGRIAGAEIVHGEPDKEVVRKADEIGADMIVVGSRGMGGVRRALMGSVSDSVLRHAHCPVLVVRGQAG